MATRTIYVKDTEIWDSAVEAANRLDISMSELIARALKAYADTECPVCRKVHELTRGTNATRT
jgi:hypothetical protein